MTLRMKSAVIRVPLLLLLGLGFGVMAAIAGAIYHQESAAAATPPTCDPIGVGGAVTIHLDGGTVTLTRVGTNLVVTSPGPPPTTCGTYPFTGGAPDVTEIDFALQGTASTSSTIVLDQTGGAFTCVPIQGTVGGGSAPAGTIQVISASGQNVVIGSNGVNLTPTTPPGPSPAGTCGATPGFSSGTGFVGLAGYQVTSHGGTAITVSANGADGTGTAASVPVTVVAGTIPAETVASSTFIGGGGNDTFTVNGAGGAGGNTYEAESGTNAFYDNGSGNTVDFSDVSASQLAINVSGVTQTVAGGTMTSGQAAVGSNVAYTFAKVAGAHDLSPFKTIIGASGGHTEFLDGKTGGFTFQSSGTGNSANFAASTSGVTVNLSSTPLPGPIATGQVGGLSAPATAPDTITPITNVTGSASGGNDFVAGGPAGTFASNGTGNTVDLSLAGTLATTATVNDSGQPGGSPANGTVSTSSPAATYDFSGLPSPTGFIGSRGGTLFLGGNGRDQYEGVGSGSNELSYASAAGSSLLVCAALPSAGSCSGSSLPPPITGHPFTGQAVLGSVHEPFLGITIFDGLTAGNTTFADGLATAAAPGNNAFHATGSNNSADFSAAHVALVSALTVDLTALTGTANGNGLTAQDTFTGLTNVVGSSQGNNIFKAGSVSDTFGDTGSVGGDTVDFGNVSTSQSTPLTINVSGSPVGAPAVIDHTAAVGSVTYFFNTTTNGDFTKFTGANSGNTLFVAGTTFGGLTFTANLGSSGNSADFSATSSGLNVDLTAVGNNVTGGGIPSLGDKLVNVTNVTGSSVGGSSFTGGSAGPYKFTGPGNNNHFVAGSGSATFAGGGTNDNVDFKALTNQVAVNVSGQQVNQTGNGMATSPPSPPGATYDFTGLAAPIIFDGSNTAKTTFFAGSAQDTFNGHSGSDVLNFASVLNPSGSLSVCLAASAFSSPVCPGAGQAVLGTVAETFAGIKTFNGLTIGNTTFVEGATGGHDFMASGSGNTADFSAAPSVKVDLSTLTLNPVTGINLLPVFAQDNLTGINTVIGSSTGGNNFVAGSGSTQETFGDHGSVQTDQIDFSHAAASQSSPLTVNVSGNGVGNETASIGVTPTYAFNTTNGDDFTKFIASTVTGAKTVFLAGSLPNYRFTGGPSDSIDFSAVAPAVTVDLSAGSSGTVTIPSGSDTITGLTTVIGSSQGENTFKGGPALGGGVKYNFTGPGNNNHFVAGTGSAVFAGGGTADNVDFKALTSPVAVNASGQQVGQTPNGAATSPPSPGSTYDFSGLAAPITFDGSNTAATTFFAGSAADTFNGHSSSDTLSFASVLSPSGSLSVCVATSAASSPLCPIAGQAVLGTVAEPFTGIGTFNGLQAGNTTFVEGPAGGHSFVASGTGNSADFSAAGSVTVDLTTSPGTVTGLTSPDNISGLNTVIGSSAGGNMFIAGTSSETFGDRGTTGGDTVNFTGVPTSQGVPLTVNVSGHPVPGVANSTAVAGPATYTFVSPAAVDFVKFIGANTGWTRFDASGSTAAGHGYTFTGAIGSPSNIADFSANADGITANMVSGAVTAPSFIAADQLLGSFLAAGNDTVVGSSAGNNTFLGNLHGTSFTAQNPAATNTVSYVDLASASGVAFNLNTSQIKALPTALGTLPDSFSFAPGNLVAQGSPGPDSFLVGTSAATIEGGGGQDALDLHLVPGPNSGTTGVTADLNGGPNAVTGPTIAGVVFTAGCAADPTQLCLTSVTGSHFDDIVSANAAALGGALPPVNITGNGGSDTLDLSRITAAASVCMPITGTSPRISPPCTGTGFVAAGVTPQPPTGFQGITFSGILGLTGTQPGGDYVYAGTGAAISSFTEAGPALGTLDYSNVPLPPLFVQPNIPGVAVAANDTGGTQQGTVKGVSSLVKVNDTFSGFGTFIGTNGNDSFTQVDPGSYTFSGGLGVNSLDLSGAPAGATMTIQSSPPGECSSGAGFSNTDGTAVIPAQLNDTFSCISNLLAPAGTTFQAGTTNAVSPGQTATLNGGGTGKLKLVNDGPSGTGATVNLATGVTAPFKDWVTGDGYNFQFSGMSTIVGTPHNDTFIPGQTNVTLVGGGGQDGLSYLGGTVPGTSPLVTYAGAPAAVQVNLSTTAYVVPTGMPNAGASVPACTAIGGYGGTITMTAAPGTCTMSDVTGTSTFSDTLVAGSATGTLRGGAGNDRFVLTNNGRTTIVAGSGSSTLDLSQLSGFTKFSRGTAGHQLLPPPGSYVDASGNIQTVIASPGGSFLRAGFGNATLFGGPGNDILAGGFAYAALGQTQTLIGNGGSDVLLGGIGTDVMQGGNQPVTFRPGQGSDTLTSPVAGNILSFAGATSGVRANLSSDTVVVPPGKPFAGSMPAPHHSVGGFSASAFSGPVGVDFTGATVSQVVGSHLTDAFVTSGSNDTIAGGGGSDFFVMKNGNNTVTETAGSSPYFLFEGAGSNTINAGGTTGSGTIDFSEAPARVIVNLQNGTATGGFGGNQTLTGIRNVLGTHHNFNDILIGGSQPGTLIGGGTGNDLLQAGPSGMTKLVGGDGFNTFCSESVCAEPGTSTGGGAFSFQRNVMIGGSGDDSFFVRNGRYDSIDGGGGFNVARLDASLDITARIQVACNTAGCNP